MCWAYVQLISWWIRLNSCCCNLTVDSWHFPPKKLGGLEKPQFFEDVYGYSEESSATHGIPWCSHPGLIFLCPFLLVSEVADSGLEPITSLKLGGSYKKWAWSEIDGPDVVEGFEYGNILQVFASITGSGAFGSFCEHYLPSPPSPPRSTWWQEAESRVASGQAVTPGKFEACLIWLPKMASFWRILRGKRREAGTMWRITNPQTGHNLAKLLLIYSNL